MACLFLCVRMNLCDGRLFSVLLIAESLKPESIKGRREGF